MLDKEKWNFHITIVKFSTLTFFVLLEQRYEVGMGFRN